MLRKKQSTKPKAEVIIEPQDDILNFVKECRQSGQAYRNKFKPVWDETDDQIAMVEPDGWDGKADWQTKVYLPFQANASEVVFSKFKKILFSGQMLDAVGNDKLDADRVGKLIQLMTTLLSRGKFDTENDVTLQEGVDIGSSFIKVLPSGDKKGLAVAFRSVYNCFFDPSCGNDFEKAKWWIDEFEKDMGELRNEINNGNPMGYDKEVFDRIVSESEGNATQPQSKTDMAAIKNVDGTADVKTPTSYKKLVFHEFWGLAKIPVEKTDDIETTNDYTLEWRVITMVNDKYILRNHANPYKRIPAFMLKTRPRKHDAYGRGYLYKGRGLQDLACSMVNLGFDSAKLSAMDIIALDYNKVADKSSIKVEPAAVWMLKDVGAAKAMKLTNGTSLFDILKGIGFLDQIHQDATSSSRQAQGTAPLLGQSGSPETLGEYKLKADAIEDKFIADAKVIEASYIVPMAKHIYSIIVNKSLFNQDACNEIIGTNTVPDESKPGNRIINAETKEEIVIPVTKEEPKLNLAELSPDPTVDFKLVGVTQLQEAYKLLEQLQKMFEIIKNFPQMAGYLNPLPLLKQIVQALRITTAEDIVKTEEQIQKEQQQAQQMAAQQQQPAPVNAQGTV